MVGCRCDVLLGPGLFSGAMSVSFQRECTFFLPTLLEVKSYQILKVYTLQGTNMSHQKSLLKMIFLFPRWDMLIPWRVIHFGGTPLPY